MLHLPSGQQVVETTTTPPAAPGLALQQEFDHAESTSLELELFDFGFPVDPNGVLDTFVGWTPSRVDV